MTSFFHTQFFKKNLLISIFAVAALVASVADAATLSVSPATGVYSTGSTFSAQIRLNTQGQPINAAEGTLKYDPQKIQVISITKGSIFNLWTADPAFSNSAGTISFGGGSPTGYTGAAGTIATVMFRAATAGTANVSFTTGSALAADGKGTNVLSGMSSAAFTIVAAEASAVPEVIEYVAPANTPGTPGITSSTHPDQQNWYTAKTAKLSWSVPAGVTQVRTLLDQSANSIPTKVYETTISEITIEDLAEGVSYFHLQFKNSDGWGKVAHYRLGVDTIKPESFVISLPAEADLSEPVQTLVFTIVDAGSGVKRYMVQLDGAEPYEFIDEADESQLVLPDLPPGHHTVIIEAFDQAENGLISTFSFTILAFDRPQFTEYPSQISSNVIPVIKGATRPNSKVTIEVREVGGGNSQVDTYEITSDASGEFIFIPDAKFRNGIYELTAVAIDKNGAQSEPSETIKIAVQDPGYIQIGSMLISFLSILVPLLALLFFLVFGILFFVRRIAKIKSVVVTETKEALTVLDAEFSHLHEALAQETKKLENSRKTKKLTKAESQLVTTLTDTLNESRKKVAKEIADVDDIVE